MFAIPTTAGTGSEVTPWGVITNHASHQKAGIGGVNLLPTVALVDPELTLDLPPFLTAATGMDALSHLVEAYVSTNRNPILDALILRGIRLVGQSLPSAVHEPHNRPARSNVMEASMLGGIALSSNWLGACHSLAHQLSTFADMHHGVGLRHYVAAPDALYCASRSGSLPRHRPGSGPHQPGPNGRSCARSGGLATGGH